MKTLRKYLKNYKKEAALSPLFKMLEALFDLFVPLVVADIIDIGIANNDMDYVLKHVLLMILLAVAGWIVSITAQFFAAKASVGFATELRQATFQHILSLSYSKIDTLGPSTLITRMTSDINQTQNGLNMMLRLLLRSPFIVFGSIIMAFIVNAHAALVFLIAVPVLSIVVYGIMIISIPLFQKVQAQLDHVTDLTRENLTGVRPIRAFRKEQSQVVSFDAANHALTLLNEFVGRISALLNPITYVLINIATIILIRQGAIEVHMGEMAQGEVVALYNYMMQMVIELVKLSSLIITLNKAIACANRVEAVLNTSPGQNFPADTQEDVSGATSPENGTTDDGGAVAFHDVSFTYEDAGAPALEHLNFDVKAGQMIGIIGGTGSGKSSLVNLIPRFYDINSGRIEIDGKDIMKYDRKSLLDKVAIVPQKAVLFSGSIRDNLRYGREDATDDELWQALEIAQAREVVEGKAGQLDFELEQNGRNLSGGQRQRLTIARAIVKNPEILILDDSASALDFKTEAALRMAISVLPATVFWVSQRASSIMQADQILVMDDGTLAGVGSHEELLENNNVYQEIYYSQFPEGRKEA